MDIPEHKHCLNCGLPIPIDQKFCTKKCEEEWTLRLRRRRNMFFMEFILIAILLIFLVFEYH
jgi:predicted nucleic acid-binding Zn ribbon protein